MTSTPPPCVLEHWSSSEVDPSIRLDYWRDVAHNWVDVQPLSPGDELEASWSLLRGENCFFGTKRSTAYEIRTSPRHVPPGEDMVVLSLLEAGEMRLNGAPGEHQHATAGMLGLYAPRQEACYHWGEGARQTYVALPRSVVLATLGREPGNLLLAPQRCALAPALAAQLAHLGLLARQPGRVSAVEYAGLLDATRALALLTLRTWAARARRPICPTSKKTCTPAGTRRHCASWSSMRTARGWTPQPSRAARAVRARGSTRRSRRRARR